MTAASSSVTTTVRATGSSSAVATPSRDSSSRVARTDRPTGPARSATVRGPVPGGLVGDPARDRGAGEDRELGGEPGHQLLLLLLAHCAPPTASGPSGVVARRSSPCNTRAGQRHNAVRKLPPKMWAFRLRMRPSRVVTATSARYRGLHHSPRGAGRDGRGWRALSGSRVRLRRHAGDERCDSPRNGRSAAAGRGVGPAAGARHRAPRRRPAQGLRPTSISSSRRRGERRACSSGRRGRTSSRSPNRRRRGSSTGCGRRARTRSPSARSSSRPGSRTTWRTRRPSASWASSCR